MRFAADDAGRRIVRGSGDDLWAAVEHAFEVWRELGQPSWDDFGLTVTEQEQRVWFGASSDSHSWLLPES